MKLISLIPGRSRRHGQRFSRASRARVALAIGLAAVALLGVTAATAQAGATPSGAVRIAAVKADTTLKRGPDAGPSGNCLIGFGVIVDEHHGTPLYSFVPGNGNVNLYFDNSGDGTDFCPVSIVNGSTLVGYQFYQENTGVCLAVNASTHAIWEGSAAACTSFANYTMWTLGTGPVDPAGEYYLYKSKYNGQCIYDDTQRPVTYSACNASNQFEWLSMP
jgi:hypothetical protein